MDPFGIRNRVTHSALNNNHALSHDIYFPLFESFFQSESFHYWLQGDKSWQLHCYGSPGCGKTTLAALAAQRLRILLSDSKETPIASVFIEQEVLTTDVVFVEDLLECIYHQLPYADADAESGLYPQYEQARYSGEPTSRRMTLLRKALHCRIQSSRYTLLILDGYDRLSEGLQTLLDRELADFQVDRLRVMLTRRIPAFKMSASILCDGCQKSDVKLYWRCKKCYWDKNIHYDLCYACKENGLQCLDDGTEYLEEMYEHVDVDISQPDGLDDFIAWDLQGLYKHFEVAEPLAAVANKSSIKVRKVIQFISSNAQGNITIAKLYLDSIYRLQSLDDAVRVGDRLPRNLVALFDAGIEQIKQRPRHESEIALMAIGAAAEFDKGIPPALLELWMRDAIARLPHLANAPPRSLGDVLQAANGFILELTGGERYVSTYNTLFRTYVIENYNSSVFWARSQLIRHQVSGEQHSDSPLPGKSHRVSRTLSRLEPGQRELASTGKILETAGESLHDSAHEPIVRTSSPTDWSIPSEKQVSFPEGHEHSSSEFGTKNVSTASRSFTMLLGKSEFKADPVKISSSKICSFCERVIFSSGDPSGYHQRSHTAFNSRHCIFCSTLYGSQTVFASENRAYHWTIRNTAKSRDSQSSIAVSFRQVNLPDTPVLEESKTQTFYLFPEDLLAHIPSKVELGFSTSPIINGGHQIKKWIQQCDQNHPSCTRSVKTQWLPTRLLDLQTGDPAIIRLVKTVEESITEPYITLSHCWGRHRFLVTMGETEEEYKTKGIRVNHLTRNFQQAIEVTRFIGIRYIWIDSFCIVQGQASDFAIEGQLMHKVYRNSYCNLVAADSEDGMGGLFRKRTPEDILPGKYRGDGRSPILGTTAWSVMKENLWDTDLLGTTIYTRGWVFQERMLSPRIIHFTRNQVFWDCSTFSASETFPYGLPPALDDSASTDRHWRGRLQESSSLAHSPLSGPNNDSLEGFWKSSVLRYTNSNLTHQADKSLAIWSIARLVRDASGDDYGAGMWSRALEEQLGWRVVNTETSLRSMELQYLQPSWSWMSVQGAVLVGEREARERVYRVKGHNGRAICFATERRKRPTIEREDSESLEQDLKIKMELWLRTMEHLKKSQRYGELKRDESSGMNPGRWPLSVIPIDDMEPRLVSKSIAIRAPVKLGSLITNTETRTYNNEIKSTRTYSLEIKIGTRRTALEAFPDEVGIHYYDPTHPVHFLILVSTAHELSANYFLDQDEEDSANTLGMSMQTTYSGTGILLIPLEEYIHHGEFHSKVKEAEERIAKFQVEHPERDSYDAWEGQKLEGDMRRLIAFIEELEGSRGTASEDRHYRRTGSFQFRDMDEKTYREIIEGQQIDLWLD